MLRWSLMGEYLALLVLAIIFIRYYCCEVRVAFTFKKKLFLGCLVMSAGSILLNIVSLAVSSVPLWLGTLINSGYFVFTGAACSLFAFVFFHLTLEHVYDQHCMKMATTVLVVLFTIYLTLVILNLFNGILFYYNVQGEYQRGPLNRIVYLLPLIQLIFLGICYIRNHKSIGASMVYFMMSMPPVVLLLCLFQVFYPDFT